MTCPNCGASWHTSCWTLPDEANAAVDLLTVSGRLADRFYKEKQTMKIKGNNELHLCEAAMIEIVQEWLNTNTNFNAKVTSIKSSSKGPHSFGFEIKLTDGDGE